ncbi:MAG TPA: hypothetical protein VFF69_09835 [Phycisphaerales bacterium]|nr:hypothetical protein [Phycisphaerales bacterium]
MSKKTKDKLEKKEKQEKRTRIRAVARVLAPEDVAPGDYVCVLSETYEWLPFFCASEYGRVQVQRATVIPNTTDPPTIVEAVCVPFVFVREAKGKRRVIDLRRVRLARVSERFGARVFDGMRTAPGA